MDRNPFYTPSGNVKNTNRTYVPDLYRQVAAEMLDEEGDSNSLGVEQQRIFRLQNRPIVGVLYSISAGVQGELFPVYIGRNTIGSDSSCDICLRETSVSALHGVLLTRKQLNDEGCEYINVVLSDNNTQYGTLVNGQTLKFDRVSCVNGDLLTIGQNYVLALSLFESFDKLTVAPDFDRIPEPVKTVEKPVEHVAPAFKAIEDMPVGAVNDHSTNITQDMQEEATFDFYKPTKLQKQDHYNNKTIIL